MDRPQKSVELFKDGFNCAQSVFASHAHEFKMDEQRGLRVASAFGGGMCHGGICGAVSGGLMVLGMRHGNCQKGDLEAKKLTAARVKAFMAAFESRNGSLICEKLLGCNPSTAEGKQEAKEKGFFKTRCPQFVLDASEILDEI
jgi:C_GCAxxG_C_C family probable redox protein